MSDKKHDRITVRFGEKLYRLALDLQRTHRAKNFSGYLRGLVIRDAINEGHSIEDLDFDPPTWIFTPDLRARMGSQEGTERPKSGTVRR